MTDPVVATPTPALKSGWKTSEFWLTLAAQVVGGLLASDVLATGSSVAKIAGVAMMVLTALGYTYSRTAIKAVAP